MKGRPTKIHHVSQKHSSRCDITHTFFDKTQGTGPCFPVAHLAILHFTRVLVQVQGSFASWCQRSSVLGYSDRLIQEGGKTRWKHLHSENGWANRCLRCFALSNFGYTILHYILYYIHYILYYTIYYITLYYAIL